MAKRGRKSGKYSLTESYLLEKLREATKLLGRSVSHRDMRKLPDFPGDTVYSARFGSWNKAKKLAGLSLIDQVEAAKRTVETKVVRYNFIKGGKNKKSSLRMRFKMLHRDNFTCQYCGRTPQHGAVLVADHVRPLSKGGENILNNLITSCFECNSGKADVLL